MVSVKAEQAQWTCARTPDVVRLIAVTEETGEPSTDGSRLPEPPKESWLERHAGVLIGAILLALAAFIAGRVTASATRDDPVSSTASSAPTADACSQVVRTATHLLDTASASDELRKRTAFHLVLDNPGCFDAETLATTRAALDMLDKHADG